MTSTGEHDNRIEFTYTEADYLAASRLFFFRSPEVLIRLIVSFILLLIGAVLITALVSDFPVGAAIALTLLVEAALLYNVLVRAPQQFFRGDGKFRDKYEMTFSDEGLSIKTRQIDSKLAWSLYTKVLEAPNFYLLVYGKEIRMMTMVPKRAFRSQLQENAFRELVARHIATRTTLDKGGKSSQIETEYQPPSSPPDWR
jgi:YcxB-like protein